MRTAAQAGISSSNRGVHIFSPVYRDPKANVQILVWTRPIIFIYPAHQHAGLVARMMEINTKFPEKNYQVKKDSIGYLNHMFELNRNVRL